MSLSAMTWAIEVPITRPTAKLALICLADHADGDGVCFPSQKSLAAKVGVSDRALRDALAWLEAEGFIVRTARHRKDGSRTSDAYQLPEEAYRKNVPGVRKETPGQPEDSSGLTSFEPPTEPITAAARERVDPKALMDQCLKAAGISDFRDERSPKLLNMGPIIGLLEAGYSLDGEILPTIRSKAVNGFRPATWSYYVPIVQQADTERRAIASQPKPDPLASLRSWPDSKWQIVLDHSRERGEWLATYGPAPGEPGCLVPPHLLAPDDQAMTRVAA